MRSILYNEQRYLGNSAPADQIYEEIVELVISYSIEQLREELPKAIARIDKLAPYDALISVGKQTRNITHQSNQTIEEDTD